MKSEYDIEKLFKDEFENWELNPPSHLKENIYSKINFNQKSNWKFIFLFSFIFLLFFVFSLFLYIKDLNADKNNFNKKEIIESSIYSDKKTQSVKKHIINHENKKLDFRNDKKINKHIEKNNIITNKEDSAFEKVNINSYKSDEKNVDLIEESVNNEIKQNNFKKLLSENINKVYNEDNITLDYFEENLSLFNKMLIENSKNINVDINDSFFDLKINRSYRNRTPILFSVSLGALFSKSFFQNNNYNLQSICRNPLSLSLLASFPLKNQLGVSFGINYQKFTMNYLYSDLVKEQKYVGVDYLTKEIIDSSYLIQYSNRFDTIYFSHIDTISITEVYKDYYRKENFEKKLKYSSINIPLMLYYEHKIKNNLFLDFYLGTSIYFNKIKFYNETDKQYFTNNSTKFAVCLKTNLRYQWEKYGIGFGNNFTYFNDDIRLFGIKQRKLIYELNLGLFYKF